MGTSRPYALSIAGYDPSGGAGLLADIKTMEQCRVYGLGVQSALTWQNESEFSEIRWESPEHILKQLHLLAKLYPVKFIKAGLIPDLETFSVLLDHMERLFPGVKVIWDPILNASAGFSFHQRFNPALLQKVLRRIYILTPNIPEVVILSGEQDALAGAATLSEHCIIYLKGGHSVSGKDHIYNKGKCSSLNRKNAPAWPKHGSGCVFSAALTAHLARGYSLHPAFLKSKSYIHNYLSSTTSLLGYHKR